jgi:hypothetical protein
LISLLRKKCFFLLSGSSAHTILIWTTWQNKRISTTETSRRLRFRFGFVTGMNMPEHIKFQI